MPAAFVFRVCKAWGASLSSGWFRWYDFFVAGDVHLPEDLAQVLILAISQYWPFCEGLSEVWTGVQ